MAHFSVALQKRPVAIQDNRISKEEQQTASIKFFGIQLPPVK